MAKSRYPALAKLFSGVSSFSMRNAPQAQEDDDDLEQQQPQGQQQRIQRGASIDQEALFEAMDTETAAAASTATKAANTRWKEAFDAEECRANPGAASRLLATTDMSAADVIDTVKDLGAPSGKPQGQQDQQRQEGLERLNGKGADEGNRSLSPPTGSGANNDGGGQDGKEQVKSKHKALVDKRNKQALAQIERNKTRA